MFSKGDIVIAATSWEIAAVCEVSRDNGAINKTGSGFLTESEVNLY